MNRNPWHGINMWKEFLYDMRHPIQLWKRGRVAFKGEHPHVNRGTAIMGYCIMGVGLLNILVGLAMILRSQVV